MENIKITLETLYDILRNEKKREDLQKLESTFFLDVVCYLREKKALLDMKKDENELFASGEKAKLEYELRSIKRILKEIYEKREKKILEIALNRSRTGSNIIDTSSMLREEREFYDQMLQILDKYRLGIISNLFKGELPDFFGGKEKIILINPETKKEELKKEEMKKENPPTFSQFESKPEVKLETKTSLSKIRFVHPLPSFVWKDLKVYGPYDVGEEIEIFPEVAELIVRKGRAVKI